ncbi:MAG TPA: amidohydrolase [Conexivisphaerales archaeon]|nr:amidohydrolase [Conexivisphaerales archaeon]
MGKRTLAVRDGLVVTMDEQRSIIEDGAVVVEGGRIVAVGDSDSTIREHRPDVVLSAKGGIVIPGLICSHTHLYGILLRGASINLPPSTDFTENLQRVWWPMDQAMTHEDAYSSALASSLEFLLSGTTTFADTYSGPNSIEGILDSVEKGVDKVGIRGILSFEATERRSIEEGERGLKENIRYIRKAKPGRCTGMMSLHASFTVSDSLVERGADAARELKAPLTMHASEGRGDLYHNMERYGMRTIERLSRLGFLGPDVVLAHAVHVNLDELKLLRQSGTNVAHNPMSNMLNAVGTSPVDTMKEMGINVSLGNDGYVFDAFENLRAAFLVHKLHREDPRVLSPLDVFEMATVNAAKAYGLGDLGVLKPGTRADMAILKPHLPTPLTPSSVYGHLVNSVSGGDVDTVLVDGEVLLEGRKPTKVGREEAVAASRRAASTLWTRLADVSSQVDVLKRD